MYFININGINLEKQAVHFRDLCTKIKKAGIHLLALAEHNLDTNKFAIRQLLQQTAQKGFPHHVMQTSTSTIPADKFYKPGGTMLLAQGDVVGRIKERGSDLDGSMVVAQVNRSKQTPYNSHISISSMHKAHKRNGNYSLPPTREPPKTERNHEAKTEKILLP